MSRKPAAVVVSPVDAFLTSTVPVLKETISAKLTGRKAESNLSAMLCTAFATLWNSSGDVPTFSANCGALFGINRNAKDGTRVFGSFENAATKDEWKVLPVGYLSRCITIAAEYHRPDVREAAKTGLNAALLIAKPPTPRTKAETVTPAAPAAPVLTVESCIAFLHNFAIMGKDPILNSKVGDIEFHLGSKTTKAA